MDLRAGSVETLFVYLNLAGAVALLLRLYFGRIAAAYRMIFVYLLVDAAGTGASLIADAAGSDKWNALSYIGTESVKIVLAALVAMELFGLALRQHPALGRAGRRVIGYFFIGASVLAVLNISLGDRYANGNPIMGPFAALERTLDLLVLLVLVLMTGFLLYFPVRMPRNVAIWLVGFTIYTFQRWVALLMVDLWPDSLRSSSTAALCVSLAALITGAILLGPEGEKVTTIPGHHWNPAEAAHLTAQLTEMNARLKRIEEHRK